MRPVLLCLAAFTFILIPHTADASVLGLRPPPPELVNPYVQLDREQILEAIDAAVADLATAPEFEQYALHLELVKLYIASNLSKHKPSALEHAREAQRQRPDALEAVIWEVYIRSGMENILPAIGRLKEVAIRFEDQAEFYYALGFYCLAQGTRYGDEEMFKAARNAFLRAARLQREEQRYLVALAASGLMSRDASAVMVAAAQMEKHGLLTPAGRLLRACAHFENGDYASAKADFVSAIERVDSRYRGILVSGSSFLKNASGQKSYLPQAYWRVMNPHPTSDMNLRQMEFTRRMVEADLLFGKADEGLAGWKTQPGEAWVRWGRPAQTLFVPVDGEMPAAPSRPGTGSRERSAGRIWGVFGARSYNTSDIDPSYHRWFWLYDYGDRSFSVVFLSTSLNFTWSMSSESNEVLEEKLREAPLLFVEKTPVANFEMNVAVAGFHEEPTLTRIETSLTVEPKTDLGAPLEVEAAGTKAHYRVDWAVFDLEDRRIDHATRYLDAAARQQSLLNQVGLDCPKKERDHFIGQVAALLPPGRYQLAVEVTELANQAHLSTILNLDLRPRPTRDLAISDLQLIMSYTPFDEAMEIPDEFVKHALAMVPRSRPSFHQGHDEVLVYYEIYNLATGDDALTRFDVAYELVCVDEEGIELESGTKLASGDLAPPPRREVFVEERMALSPLDSVIKGTHVRLGDLPAGNYRALIVVVDKIRGSKAVRSVGLRIVD